MIDFNDIYDPTGLGRKAYKSISGSGSQEVPAPSIPEIPGYVKENVDQARTNYENIGKSAPQVNQKRYFSEVQNPLMSRLSENIAKTNLGAAGRGLLHSGLREQSLADQATATGQQMAKGLSDINTQTQTQYEQARQTYMDAMDSYQKLQQARNDAEYNYELEKYKQKQQQWSNMFGFVGTVAGGVLGRA